MATNVEVLDADAHEIVASGKSFGRIMNGTTNEVELFFKTIEEDGMAVGQRLRFVMVGSLLCPTATPLTSAVTFITRFGTTAYASFSVDLFNGGGDTDYANAAKPFTFFALISQKTLNVFRTHTWLKPQWVPTLSGVSLMGYSASGANLSTEPQDLRITVQLNQDAHDQGVNVFCRHKVLELI